MGTAVVAYIHARMSKFTPDSLDSIDRNSLICKLAFVEGAIEVVAITLYTGMF